MARLDEDRRLATHRVEQTRIVEAVRELAARFPQVEAAWLFGSYAHGTERRTSDVDVAVMTSRELAGDWTHKFDLQNALEELLGVPVDVVLLSTSLPWPLLWEILRKPVLLFAREPERATAFASYLRSLVRDDWPRLERRWERTRQWLKEPVNADVEQ